MDPLYEDMDELITGFMKESQLLGRQDQFEDTDYISRMLSQYLPECLIATDDNTNQLVKRLDFSGLEFQDVSTDSYDVLQLLAQKDSVFFNTTEESAAVRSEDTQSVANRSMDQFFDGLDVSYDAVDDGMVDDMADDRPALDAGVANRSMDQFFDGLDVSSDDVVVDGMADDTDDDMMDIEPIPTAATPEPPMPNIHIPEPQTPPAATTSTPTPFTWPSKTYLVKQIPNTRLVVIRPLVPQNVVQVEPNVEICEALNVEVCEEAPLPVPKKRGRPPKRVASEPTPKKARGRPALEPTERTRRRRSRERKASKKWRDSQKALKEAIAKKELPAVSHRNECLTATVEKLSADMERVVDIRRTHFQTYDGFTAEERARMSDIINKHHNHCT